MLDTNKLAAEEEKQEDASSNIKQEYNDNKNEHQLEKRRRKKWMIMGIFALILCIVIVISIAIPMTILHNKKNSNQLKSNLNPDLINAASSSSIAGGEGNGEDMMIKQQSLVEEEGKLYTIDNQLSQHPPAYAHAISPYANLIRLKTYTPPTDARIFVMGDIHGCLNEMNALLIKIQFQPQKDVLILTGDLVFRGQDSLGVIRRAREIGALCVRGNHDDKVIRLRGFQDKFGIDAMTPPKEIMPEGPVGDPLKFKNKHGVIARMLTVDDYNYMTSCPLILDIPNLNARVVHGGLDPAIENIIDNDPWSVMNMRDMDSNNEPSKHKLKKHAQDDKNIKHWTTAYQEHFQGNNSNVPTIFYGHDASRGLLLGTQTIGMDSGCVYGRKLSVIDVNSKQLYQVDCDQVSSENKKEMKENATIDDDDE